MKKMKKFLSVLLASAMTLAMAATSFAALVSGTGEGNETAGEITITNAIPGKNYSIYKLFDLESYSYDENEDNPDREGQYAYKVTDAWMPFVTGEGAGAAYVTVDTQGYVTWKNGADAVQFGKDALAYAKGIDVDPVVPVRIKPIKTADARALTDDEKNADPPVDRVELSFTGLNLGYYLVDSSAGALCGLTTTNPTIDIEEKNAGVPETEKKIVLNPGDMPVDEANARIGSTVTYEVTITAKEGAENYVFHDKMDAGLTFNPNSVVVTGVPAGSYTLTHGANAAPYTFNVAFDQDALDRLTYTNGEAEITISYSATLNENAVIGVAGNKNAATLSYGDNGETTASTATVYTYEFDLVKTGTNNILLTGAEFKLYDAETDGNEILLVKDGADTYRVATETEKNASGFTSAVIEAGKVVIKGLNNGTYWLEETKAPNGYNKLAARESVTITDADNKATMDGNTWTTGGLHVINNTGAILPGTGGIGTTIFYAVGIILMAGAVFFVVRRKRA